MTYRLVSSSEDMEQFLTIATRGGILALDTEFTRTRTYYPMLSTIQICLPHGEIFIFDALDGSDLGPLSNLLMDQAVTKIIHASRQDIEAMNHYFKCMPRNIVDTQILANVCDLGAQCSYADLAKRFGGADIDKTFQRSNWQKRPLKIEQLHYICDDVRFLQIIYESLLSMLPDTPSCIAELEQSFAHLTQESSYQFDVKKFCRRYMGRLGGDAGSKAIATKLVILREQVAMKRNMARVFVIRDTDILAIARYKPANLHQLQSICRLQHAIDPQRILSIVNTYA